MVTSQSSNVNTFFSNVGATGFVAVDKTRDLIVIGFRGSEDLSDFMSDQLTQLDMIPTDQVPNCRGCLGHRGFLRAWSSTRIAVMQNVIQARKDNPGFQVVATGHSLGAALAHFAALELRAALRIPVNLVSFDHTSYVANL
jgi:Lipase (class 3)